MIETLESCPFCRGEVRQRNDGAIACEDGCGVVAHFPDSFERDDGIEVYGEEAAIAAWNSRSEPDADAVRRALDLGDDVECPEVGYEPDGGYFFIEWIRAKGWRLSGHIYDNGTISWAGILGDDRRKGSDIEGFIKARDDLARTALATTKGEG